jgi:hypothetical protein
MSWRFGTNIAISVVAASAILSHRVFGDTFGSGVNTFSIDFVTIGSPGNAADTHGAPNPAGAVPYTYRMGEFEISRAMINKANAAAALNVPLWDMTFYGGNRPDEAATGMHWIDAARFVNWLDTSSGSVPAYTFNDGDLLQPLAPGDAGYNARDTYRNSQARYFLPTENEWYKTAYYDPATANYFDYPTGSNATPTAVANGTAPGTAVYGFFLNQPYGPADITDAGGLSSYGTMAQGGNVFEFLESDFLYPNYFDRATRGGAWDSFDYSLSSSGRSNAAQTDAFLDLGFRVASAAVPEPYSIVHAAIACAMFLAQIGRKQGTAHRLPRRKRTGNDLRS